MTTDDVLKQLYNSMEIKMQTWQNIVSQGGSTLSLSTAIAAAKVEAYQDILMAIQAVLCG